MFIWWRLDFGYIEFPWADVLYFLILVKFWVACEYWPIHSNSNQLYYFSTFFIHWHFSKQYLSSLSFIPKNYRCVPFCRARNSIWITGFLISSKLRYTFQSGKETRFRLKRLSFAVRHRVNGQNRFDFRISIVFHLSPMEHKP